MRDTQKNLYKKLLGGSGERAALKFLKKSGYKIIDKNFSCQFGEVDIIAEKSGYIAFIEVKTRTTDKFGAPSEAVGFKKREHYRRCCSLYLKMNPLMQLQPRFDIIEIFNNEINHIEDAFQ